MRHMTNSVASLHQQNPCEKARFHLYARNSEGRMRTAPNSWVWLLQFLSCKQQCSCDMIFNLRNFNISYDAPKFWHFYLVKKFMEKTLERFPSTNLPSQLHKFSEASEKIEHKELVEPPRMITRLVKIPSGSIIANPLVCITCETSLCYRFDLNVLFQLNITFHEMYMVHTKGLWIATRTANGSELYTFWGYYSVLGFYPKLKVVEIRGLTCDHYMRMNATFTLMDENVVCNIDLRYSHSKSAPFVSYHVQGVYTLRSYFLKVNKLSHVVIEFIHPVRYWCKIYNGPGAFANSVKCGHAYICSTFQCIVHAISEKGLFEFRFSSKFLPFSQQAKAVQNLTFTVDLPNHKCFESFCTLFIDTENGFQINTTVTKIVHIRFTDPGCLLGGLVAGERLTHDYRQTDTLCNCLDGTQNLVRSFYSHNSSIILLLYWYNSYNKIFVTVRIA